MSDWTTNDIPDQTGKLVLITGATGGLGYETALALAGKGAEIVLTGRSDNKGAEALARIRAIYPGALVSYETLDLASLKSVADFAARFSAAHDHLDVLVNNGGVMMPPRRQTTADGFELQFGTNYLSHFALTAALLPPLTAAKAPRVVNVSSGVHNMGQINFDDLQGEQGYAPMKYYSQSKLANLMFALELQRRSDADGWRLMSTAAHPGWATTGLMANGPGTDSLMFRMSRVVAPMLAGTPRSGALPQLYAATDPRAKKGAYYGPSGLLELKGPPGKVGMAGKAKDLAVAARLWTISEQLTGVHYPALARAA
jgi:NAD(P)-dependent dehydrogenase (short-subunit alcohol dehydrogenase family)